MIEGVGWSWSLAKTTPASRVAKASIAAMAVTFFIGLTSFLSGSLDQSELYHSLEPIDITGLGEDSKGP